MKHIFAVLLAAVLLISMLGGCARDMSGETRATTTPGATVTARPTATARPSATPKPTDSTADGVIDAGRDAVDGVVGAGEELVDDIVDAGEDLVDGVTGAKSTADPAATPKATAGR